MDAVRKWEYKPCPEAARPLQADTTIVAFFKAVLLQLCAISGVVQGSFFLMKKPLGDCALVYTCRRTAIGSIRSEIRADFERMELAIPAGHALLRLPISTQRLSVVQVIFQTERK